MTQASLEQEFKSLNQIAEVYDDGPFDRVMRTYMVRSLQPFFKPGSALEIGCFNGAFSVHLAKLFDDLTVIDAVDEFLDNVRRLVGDRAKTVCTLVENFDTPKRFDNIFLTHILEHLIDPVSVLKKAASLLSEGGRIHLVVPNGGAASRQIAVKMGILNTCSTLSDADTKLGHRRVYFLDTLVGEARDAGLSVVQTGGIFFKPLANFQFDKLIGGDLISDRFMDGCYELGKEHPGMSASVYAVCEAGRRA